MSEENTTSEAVNFYAELSAKDDKFTPTFEKSRGKKWVSYGHKGDNRYPTMLLELFKNSSLHGMIVKSKANQSIGQGYGRADKQKLEGEQENFIENADGRGNSLKDIDEKCALDLELFGGYAKLVTWDSTWSKIVRVSYVSIMNLRAYSKLNEFGEVTGFIHSTDWSKRQPYEPSYIPIFSTGTAAEIKKQYAKAFDELNKEELTRIDAESRTQVIVEGYYLPDSVYYPVPFYGAATMVIKTDIESDAFAHTALESKLTSDYVVKINGITDQGAFNNVAKQFVKSHTGATAAGKPPIVNGGQEGMKSIEIIPTGLKGSDSKFTEINMKTQQKILSSHGVTSPTLVGIAPSGGLGNSSDLEKLSDLFQANIISVSQAKLEKGNNKVMRVNDWALLEIIPNMNVFAEQKEEGESVVEKQEESQM